MTKQHHFVVVFDEETGEFEVDFDTQEAKFDGKPIYDLDTEEWEGITEQIEDENSIYNRSADALFLALRGLPLREVE